MRTAGHIAIIGAGWAGCAAAVRAVQNGAQVTLMEASRTPGGRARSVAWPDVPGGALDNGQHILIGAYTECLALMRTVGADPAALLHRLPLDLRTPDGKGLAMRPSSSAQWATVRAILTAPGWSPGDKLRLLLRAAQWQRHGFACALHASVADLCHGLGSTVLGSMIAPLCIAAFNSTPEETSGAVFLRVLRDAMLGEQGGSDVLIARKPIGALLPEPALAWLAQQPQAQVLLGHRALAVERVAPEGGKPQWHIQTAGETSSLCCDQIILACPAWEAARLVQAWADSADDPDQKTGIDQNACHCGESRHPPSGRAQQSLEHGIRRDGEIGDRRLPPAPNAKSAIAWATQAAALQHAPIATVYAWGNAAACAHLPPMQALHCTHNAQAQFAFHHPQRQRTAVGGEAHTLLAFVASACTTDRTALEAAIGAQAEQQLGLPPLTLVQTLIEKRATFVCRPDLQRPPMHIAPHLLACGDYVQGPYPATLEGAVRSGICSADAACKR